MTFKNALFFKHTKLLGSCNTTAFLEKKICQLGAVAHAYNPSTLEAKASRLSEVRSSRSAWPMWRNPVSTKNTKISWV